MADEALCCLIALFRAETSADLVAGIPEDRRATIQEGVARLAGVPREELLQRLVNRRSDDAVAWASLPKPLQQWVRDRRQDTHG